MLADAFDVEWAEELLYFLAIKTKKKKRKGKPIENTLDSGMKTQNENPKKKKKISTHVYVKWYLQLCMAGSMSSLAADGCLIYLEMKKGWIQLRW